jgi:hypothetical protein
MKHLQKTSPFRLMMIVIFILSVLTEVKSQVNYNNTVVTGTFASAIGSETKATGNYSFAAGAGSEATATFTTAMGFYAFANYSNAIAIGSAVKSNVYKSIVMGSGSFDHGMYLENNVMESLMVGFNSKFPTLLVVQPNEQDLNYTKTGSIGIGNITSPLAKLHLKADEGEAATFFIQPNDWSSGDFAHLFLGNFYNGITADTNQGLRFLSQKNYLFETGNMGLGVDEPKAKLHVDGDILFENATNGMILKSEDGQCWKVTANNDGTLLSTSVDCNSVSGVHPNDEPSHAPLYFYPNPTSGYLVIDNRENIKGLIAEYRSVAGTLLMTMNLQEGENRADVSFLSDGLVIVTVYNQEGKVVKTEKILVAK